jgi:hypothetical protein
MNVTRFNGAVHMGVRRVVSGELGESALMNESLSTAAYYLWKAF